MHFPNRLRTQWLVAALSLTLLNAGIAAITVSATRTAATEERSVADVNCDGAVTIADSLRLARILARLDPDSCPAAASPTAEPPTATRTATPKPVFVP